LVSELGEIRAFLKTKLSGDGANDLLSVPQALNLSSNEQHTLACEKANEWLELVVKIEEELADEGFLRLLRIVDSEVYLEKLCSDLKRKSLLSSKYKKQIEECRHSQKSAVSSRNGLQPKLKEFQTACKKQKVYLEKCISKKYNDRPVNIMGQFNFA